MKGTMFMGAIYLLLAGTAESMDKRRRKKVQYDDEFC